MARKTKRPADMSALFQSTTGTLTQIATKTNSLNILADIVRQICPDLPADAWHIANFKDKSLVIEVISSVWGQRLQFERNNICSKLSSVTEGAFTQIEIKVSPYRNKVVPKQPQAPSKTKFISPETAAHLERVALDAPEGLKHTLQRLAALANKNRQ